MKKYTIMTFAAFFSLILGSGCAATAKNTLVVPEEIETLKVYESILEEKPGHNQWPTAFLDRNGELCVIFQNVFGDLTQTPGYDYRDSQDSHPGKYRISRIGMQYDRQSKTFRKKWQTERENSFFCIMAPHPTPSGKVIGICSAAAFPEKKFGNNSIVVCETPDCGKTFNPISTIVCPDVKEFCPNDIRCNGNRIYLAAYDGLGAAYLSVSEDEGKSWSKPFKFVEYFDNMTFHEPTIAELANGDIMAVLRTHRMDIPKHNGINYHIVILSPDGNGSWTATKPQDTGFGFRGRPYLLRTRDNILVLAAPGQFLALSLNGGKTWETGIYDFRIPEVKILWQGEIKPFNHNAETTLVELPDGRLYYSYFIGSDFPFPPPCDEYIGGTFFRLNRN